jgi:hypothetical protein
MHGPTCIFWANLTPFSLKGLPAPDDRVAPGPPRPDAAADESESAELLSEGGGGDENEGMGVDDSAAAGRGASGGSQWRRMLTHRPFVLVCALSLFFTLIRETFTTPPPLTPAPGSMVRGV